MTPKSENLVKFEKISENSGISHIEIVLLKLQTYKLLVLFMKCN